ncbi:MAG: efflux RND transporter periplasmic adaptor subunit [Polyangia bacterium]
MNRPPDKDGIDEHTNPGMAPPGRGESSVIVDGVDPSPGAAAAAPDDEDEFPSETTRIDPNFMSGGKPAGSPVRTVASLDQLAAQRAQNARSSGSNSAPPPSDRSDRAGKQQNAKLAALKSLSLGGDGGSGTSRLPPAPRPQSSSKLPWLLVVAMGGAIGGNYYWTHRTPSGPIVPSGPVLRTERIAMTGGSGQSHVAAGYTNAMFIVQIGTPVSGTVKTLDVDNNDKVKRGQIVVTLDASAAQAELAPAIAAVRDAERLLTQTNQLFKAQAATAVEVSNARGAVDVARSKLRPIEQRIDQARIHAPSDATVMEVLVHPGEAVNAGAPLLKVADLTKLVAEVDINESDLVKIRRGQNVDITSDAAADTYHGKVREISAQADRAKGTVLVKVDLQVPDQALRPNMSVKCTFLPMQGEQPRMYISKTSINSQGNVWIIGPDHYTSARPVKVGQVVGSTVEVLSGLKEGDEIVSDSSLVRDHQLIAPPAPPPPAQ